MCEKHKCVCGGGGGEDQRFRPSWVERGLNWHNTDDMRWGFPGRAGHLFLCYAIKIPFWNQVFDESKSLQIGSITKRGSNAHHSLVCVLCRMITVIVISPTPRFRTKCQVFISEPPRDKFGRQISIMSLTILDSMEGTTSQINLVPQRSEALIEVG